MSEGNQPQKKSTGALLVALLITEAYAVAGIIPGLTEERSRHKGGRRQRKKTWIEKQQARRGWGE